MFYNRACKKPLFVAKASLLQAWEMPHFVAHFLRSVYGSKLHPLVGGNGRAVDGLSSQAHTLRKLYFHFLSHWFWTKWNSIWFKIKRKTITTIISNSMWKEMEGNIVLSVYGISGSVIVKPITLNSYGSSGSVIVLPITLNKLCAHCIAIWWVFRNYFSYHLFFYIFVLLFVL